MNRRATLSELLELMEDIKVRSYHTGETASAAGKALEAQMDGSQPSDLVEMASLMARPGSTHDTMIQWTSDTEEDFCLCVPKDRLDFFFCWLFATFGAGVAYSVDYAWNRCS